MAAIRCRRGRTKRRRTEPTPEPTPTPEPATRTVKDLCEAYMKLHVLNNNCVAQQKMARYYIDKVIVPRFGDHELSVLKQGT
jgi:hypothetical protein